MGKLREGCPIVPGTCREFLARWESCFQDEKLPLAAFASGIHSYLYLITGLAQNLPFEKKNQGRVSFSDTGLGRKQETHIPSSPKLHITG